MSIPRQSPRQESSAPNAILDHMRRRIARVGLLVAFMFMSMAALAIIVACAYAGLR